MPRKKKTEAEKGGYTLEENLALTNEELTSNWSKLASLIRQVENIKWEDARIKATDLLKDKSRATAYAYIDEVRSGATSKSDPKPTETKSETKTKVVKHPATQKRDQFSMNYRRLLKLAPDLEERLLKGEEVYGKSIQTGYMDFNLELIHKDSTGFYLAISHYFKQNGDMVADPDMVIRFDPDTQIVEALSYQDQWGYKEVYDNIYDRKMVRMKEKQAQNSFLSGWLTRLRKQGHSIEWRHIEKPEPPKGRKSRSNSESNTYDKPDISYMDDTVIAGVKEYINSIMLDTVLQLYIKHRDKEQPMRPLAQYFAVDRILYSPIINPNVSYPTDEELKSDYEKLRAFQEREKQVDEMFSESIVDESTERMEKEQNEEIQKTVKYWAKLAAVIRENEKGITPEEAKEKALKLKEEGKAEEYVIQAFVNQRKNGLDKQLKKNYDALLVCLPEFHEKLNDETAHAFIVLSKEKGYKLEKAASINKSTEQYALYDDGTGTLLFAVQKVRKRAWVTVMTGNFFGKSIAEDYMSEAYSKSSSEHYNINLQFEKWLNKTTKKKQDIAWGKIISAIKDQTEKTDVEQTMKELRSKYPVVLEWTEGAGDDLRGFKSLEELQKGLLENGFTGSPDQTYIKNKIWFDGFPSYVRIDVSKIEGDYDPESDALIDWLNKYEKGFDWSVFSKTEKKQIVKKVKKEESEIIIEFDMERAKKDAQTIPDFEPGKVELTEAHKRAGITQKDINWINKHKQGITITPRRNPINNTKSLEKDLDRGAKRPGKRVSRTGKIYYEGRSNRSDLTDAGL